MKSTLFLASCWLLLGCSSSSDKASESSVAAPPPVLVTSDEGELRGHPRVRVMENGAATLIVDASNESVHLTLTLDWLDKWTGDTGDLRTSMELGNTLGRQGSGVLEVDGTEKAAESGTVTVALSKGLITGTFEIKFGDQISKGSISGKLGLECWPLGSRSIEEQGGAPTDGQQTHWVDQNFESDFCQTAQRSIGATM